MVRIELGHIYSIICKRLLCIECFPNPFNGVTQLSSVYQSSKGQTPINQPTNQIRTEAVACCAIMKHDALGVFMRDVHGRRNHFWIHVSHLQMDIVDSGQKVTKIPATDLCR